MSPGLYTKFPGRKLGVPSDCHRPGMGEHMTALKERMQPLQETSGGRPRTTILSKGPFHAQI